MKKHLALLVVAAAFLMNAGVAATQQHTDSIAVSLQQRAAQFKGNKPELLTYINAKMPKEEADAMRFLVAYMPLSDLVMHDGSYVHNQVRCALEARRYFAWGKAIPEKVFRHFVLPYRINNEYTDSARIVFFQELKERVKKLSMREAALEVNHWCHEKVTYRGTDERTSGPLTTVRTAFGRCGEESTFTVAALRAVSIPARQVYTPRWAHTDDNHAWVEVWIDGKWHFMGACEPESDLDLGWFAAPVKRAMMTHTVVFGQYHGTEETLQSEVLYTRINLLENYTQTRKVNVKVVNGKGKPENQSKVEFMLYNYAEFYPIATKYTETRGTCSAVTGFGDFVVWASKGGRYGFTKVNAHEADTVTVVLAEPNFVARAEQMEIVPPVAQSVVPANAEKAALNNHRLQQEDSIRAGYEKTFIDSASIEKVVAKKGLRYADIQPFFKQSRGNWREIEKFMLNMGEASKPTGMALLRSMSEKDFHDITAAILNDHLMAIGDAKAESEITEKYVWGIRVGKEMVTCWRSFLQRNIAKVERAEFTRNPEMLVGWIKQRITIDTVGNYYNVPLSPESVFRFGVADRYSRNLFFVAVCRTVGIPARFEPATRVPQFYRDGAWHNVQFEESKAVMSAKGMLTLTNPDSTIIPQYYPHYTIARFQNGQFTTLDYEGSPEVAKFPCTLSLDTGYYRVMTGNRLNDGSVLCNMNYFMLNENSKVEMPIAIRPLVRSAEVLGKANLEAAFSPITNTQKVKLSDYVGSKGLVVAVIDPDKEPTKHLVEDIKAVKERMNAWGGTLLLVVRSGRLTTGFKPENYAGLPANTVWGYDSTGDVGNAIDLMCGNNGGAQAPQVSVINGSGEIVYYSEGYSIGMGDTVLKNLSK